MQTNPTPKLRHSAERAFQTFLYRHLNNTGGVNYDKLFHLTGVHKKTISAIFHGKGPITLGTAYQILDGLGIEPASFFLFLDERKKLKNSSNDI